jgi:hypothetical protein
MIQSAGVSGVGDCPRLVLTLGDPGETCGPRIDSIPPARLTTSAPRIKKLFFSPPNKCPIDLFGPVSNRTILKQVRVVFRGPVFLLFGFLKHKERHKKQDNRAIITQYKCAAA